MGRGAGHKWLLGGWLGLSNVNKPATMQAGCLKSNHLPTVNLPGEVALCSFLDCRAIDAGGEEQCVYRFD